MRSLSLLWRRYTEFEQLRAYLEVTYLWAIVPPLPEKRPLYTWQNAPTDTFDPDFVDRRRAGLEVSIFTFFLSFNFGWSDFMARCYLLQTHYPLTNPITV